MTKSGNSQVERQSWRKMSSESCPGELTVPGQVGLGSLGREVRLKAGAPGSSTWNRLKVGEAGEGEAAWWAAVRM